jgi:hypothetical protein
MADEKQKNGLATKLLLPVVATVASGVASYLAKKGPQLLEETVLPKLREAKDAAPSPRDVLPGGGSGDDGGGDDEVPNDELERRRRERAEHRAARRKAS